MDERNPTSPARKSDDDSGDRAEHSRSQQPLPQWARAPIPKILPWEFAGGDRLYVHGDYLED